MQQRGLIDSRKTYAQSEKGKAYMRAYMKEYDKTEKRKAYLQRYRKSKSFKANQRREHLRYQYGLTEEKYNNLLTSQESKCAICKEPERTRRLSVDHCHGSGSLRGLLCRRCNLGLGYFHDSTTHLRAAIRYLLSYQGKEVISYV